jgi:6-phosphofructokinase 1
MARRIGILTSGGDCPGLNAAIRGVAKAAYRQIENVEIIGIASGFHGLIHGDHKLMNQSDFSGILTLGGTILGTRRTPFKNMHVVEEDNIDKIANMKANYKKMQLDCLLTLGGNGTHKTANLLSNEGLNVIGLPKTIDNDIWGTDVTFGFHTAVDIATDVIDRVHTTAASHGRVMVVELMGNRAGWLTLYSGIAGGADVILIPEIAYDGEKVIQSVGERAQNGKAFSIIAIAEGAVNLQEEGMKRKSIKEQRSQNGFISASQRLAGKIEAATGIETRVVVPGYIQRGGIPSAYDRLLSTQFGVQAAKLIADGHFGVTVALKNNQLSYNALKDVAFKLKSVPIPSPMVDAAKDMGLSFGV